MTARLGRAHPAGQSGPDQLRPDSTSPGGDPWPPDRPSSPDVPDRGRGVSGVEALRRHPLRVRGDRLHQLEFATSQGFTLAHTAVLEGEHYATFVDTLTQDRSL